MTQLAFTLLQQVGPPVESTRPTFPVPEGVTYTSRQPASPQHLVDVHDALRAELERLRDIVRQVADGALEVGSARSAINRMTVRQINWTPGAYCAQNCRVVTGYHTLEDSSVFPHLRRRATHGRAAPNICPTRSESSIPWHREVFSDPVPRATGIPTAAFVSGSPPAVRSRAFRPRRTARAEQQTSPSGCSSHVDARTAL